MYIYIYMLYVVVVCMLRMHGPDTPQKPYRAGSDTDANDA